MNDQGVNSFPINVAQVIIFYNQRLQMIIPLFKKKLR